MKQTMGNMYINSKSSQQGAIKQRAERTHKKQQDDKFDKLNLNYVSSGIKLK